MGNRKGYTHEDYRRLADEGVTVTEAARRLGVSHVTVVQTAKAHGFSFPRGTHGRPLAAGLAVMEAREALQAVYDFLLAEYGSAEAQAMEGEVVSADARPVWGKVCAALARLSASGDA